VLSGIGGQGILLAAEIVGTAAVHEGHNVRVSELHGMAQRGGAVVSHVRIGSKVLSPTIMEGSANVIMGFEPMEALRSVKFANDQTSVLINGRAVKVSGAQYPAMNAIFERIRRFTEHIITIDAFALAEKSGAAITQNAVMVGALASVQGLPIKASMLRESLAGLVPSRYRTLNEKAFDLGCEHAKAASRQVAAVASPEQS
jgi:indolepyruvate ferredoxin oxidoreductase beta subunit